MTLLLYGVTRPGPLSVVDGLDERPLRLVPAAPTIGLAAIVGEIETPPRPARAQLLRYEEAVEAVMATRPLLPARFGTTLPDEPAVLNLLCDRHRELDSALRRVDGAVEIGVRACWPPAGTAAATVPAGPPAGADYLRAQLERRRHARRIADEIEAAVGELARERAARILPRPETPVSVAYLVDRRHVSDFRDRCERLAPGAEIVCTGPWPPYSFVGGDAA